jgi:hypothetical protein
MTMGHFRAIFGQPEQIKDIKRGVKRKTGVLVLVNCTRNCKKRCFVVEGPVLKAHLLHVTWFNFVICSDLGSSIRIAERGKEPDEWETVEAKSPLDGHSHRILRGSMGPLCRVGMMTDWYYFADPLCVTGRGLVSEIYRNFMNKLVFCDYFFNGLFTDKVAFCRAIKVFE